MRRVMTLVACGAILLGATGVASANPVLYGSNGNGGTTPGGLVTVNPTTGGAVLIADTITPGGLAGIAFASPSVLFGTTVSSGNPSALVQIDPLTGAVVSTIGNVGMSIGDLAYDSNTGTLYGVRSNSDGLSLGGRLYSINTSTGAATFIGNTGAGAGGGLAFDPVSGWLYQTAYNNGFDFTSLNVLNPANAGRISTTAIAGYFDGLTYYQGTLYAVPGGTSPSLYTINPITGATTLVGSNTAGYGLSDLDFQPTVPEPAALSMFGLGILAAARRLRRAK